MNTLIEQFEENHLHDSVVNVYVWGSAECDQFELKDEDGEDISESKRPIAVSMPVRVVSVACGGLHTLFLTDGGQVYGSGCNDVFAVGKSETSESDRIPTLVELPIRVNMISAGDSHSIALNSLESMVYFWGVYKNTNGNMQSPIQKPTRVGADVFNKPIQKLLSGYNHTIVLMDRKAYLWGDSDTKVLGRKSITRQSILSSLRPEALGIYNIQDVFTGGYHSFIKAQRKMSDHLVNCYYAWGLNNYGQLGIGSTEDALIPQEIVEFRNKDVVSIVGGEHHTLALTREGEVYSFGRNDDGQIGLGLDTNLKLKEEAQERRLTKIEDLKYKQIRSKSQKKVLQKIQEDIQFMETTKLIGYEYITTPQKIQGLEGIEEVLAAGHYSYAVSHSRQAFFSWGVGFSYVLGDRKEESVFSPYEVYI